MTLTLKQHINILSVHCGLKPAAIARVLGLERQTFYRKLLRSDLTYDELNKIAEAVGAEYKSVFVFPDGKEV